MHAAGRQWFARLAAPTLLAALLAACDTTAPVVTPEPDKPPGAVAHTIVSPDGTELSARLWERDGERVIVYYHEYLSDQSLWWPHIDRRADGAASALTLDFRGHGESSGETDEFEAHLEDAEAALAWVRERGYEQITLVGSGMGAAVAMKAAHDDPELWVIGLSAPSEFSDLRPLETARALRDRLALIATEGDLSAAHSLELFIEAIDLPEDRWRLFEGRAHGVEMLVVEGHEEARDFFLEMLAESWRAR
jgi:pimeloyl-ACP methyl ester carboxylesterase